MQENFNVSLLLENRKKLTMSRVESVDAFTEQTLTLTVVGDKVQIIGQKLKVVSFNKSSGALVVEGIVNEIKYNFKKPPFYKRIFK